MRTRDVTLRVRARDADVHDVIARVTSELHVRSVTVACVKVGSVDRVVRRVW